MSATEGSAGARTQGSDDELNRFARAFEDEAHLRRWIKILLEKMGREEVRITHGTQEKGKDIVFYAPGGLGERTLYACVVKKERITGSISSRTSAKEVLAQAEQVFDEPHTNPNNGQQEQVKGVYIMSPHECPLSTIGSVRQRLASQGRTVEFCCGTRLMGLFATHCKDFLLFESNVLVSYLSALRAGLSKDVDLVNLILGRGLQAELPGAFQEMYVPQTFSQELRYCSVTKELRQDLALPGRPVRLADVRALQQRLRTLLRLVEYLQGCPGKSVALDSDGQPQAAVEGYVGSLDAEWQRAYKAFTAAALKEFETMTADERKRRPGRALRADMSRSTPRLSSERAATVSIEPCSSTEAWRVQAEEVRAAVVRLLEADCLRVRVAGTAGERTPAQWLSSEEVAAYCRLLDLEENVPGSISVEQQGTIRRLSFVGTFLEDAPRLTLLTGPAGFGKTSFCKWQALTSADLMLKGGTNILPVFLPLHRFAYGAPATEDEAFFQTPELRQLLYSPGLGTRIRLFLDGLDEIPDAGRQCEVVRLARSAVDRLPNLQVVITARDHVVGPWLSGIVRLRVDQLDAEQQKTLVAKWLSSDEATEGFFKQLARVPSLQPLMGVPLLAMLIVAVYRRQQYLPESRTRLYSLFVELLCGGWDAAKGVHRSGRFGLHDKRTVLVRLAGVNHLARRRDSTFNHLRAAIKNSLAGLEEHWQDLLDEMLQDGLIVSTGDGLRFSHLSFQEFLAAEALNEPTGERLKVPLKEYLHGDDWWREVLSFYVTRFGTPSDTEEWLVRRAREAARTAAPAFLFSGDLDERLTWLRRCLREAFPAFQSRYPEDGIVEETAYHRSSTDTVISRTRRRLSGARVDEH